MTQFELCQELWHQKTRVHGLSCGIVCMMLGLAIFDTISACDRLSHTLIHRYTHTHKDTRRQNIPC